jgi:hypothetical protein
MNKVLGSSVTDMQHRWKEREELQRLHEILLASQDEPPEKWHEESVIIAERETYDAIMAEVLPLVTNSGYRPH